MQRRDFLISAAGLTASSTVGCGWILHPERCGQPHSHEIDWKIAALDGLGLLLFFVPGVVAFVVDFYTGAIYLPAPCPTPSYPPPPGYPPPSYPEPVYTTPVSPTSATPAPVGQPTYPILPPPGPQASHQRPLPITLVHDTPLACVHVPREELSPPRIEAVVARHAGQNISLAQSQTRLSPLSRLDAYAVQRRRHESDSKFGFGIQTLLSRWQSAV